MPRFKFKKQNPLDQSRVGEMREENYEDFNFTSTSSLCIEPCKKVSTKSHNKNNEDKNPKEASMKTENSHAKLDRQRFRKRRKMMKNIDKAGSQGIKIVDYALEQKNEVGNLSILFSRKPDSIEKNADKTSPVQGKKGRIDVSLPKVRCHTYEQSSLNLPVNQDVFVSVRNMDEGRMSNNINALPQIAIRLTENEKKIDMEHTMSPDLSKVEKGTSSGNEKLSATSPQLISSVSKEIVSFNSAAYLSFPPVGVLPEFFLNRVEKIMFSFLPRPWDFCRLSHELPIDIMKFCIEFCNNEEFCMLKKHRRLLEIIFKQYYEEVCVNLQILRFYAKRNIFELRLTSQNQLNILMENILLRTVLNLDVEAVQGVKALPKSCVDDDIELLQTKIVNCRREVNALKFFLSINLTKQIGT